MAFGSSRGGRDSRLTAHFAAEQADMQTQLLVLQDAFNTLEKTVSELMDHLVARGDLDAGAEVVARWQTAVALLRKQGLRAGPLPGEEVAQASVTCPGCDAVLRNVTGAPGDRCDWCGYVFQLTCPSCGKELPHATGEPGELCLWCHHQLA
jgi:hypothetical protein